MPKTIDDIIPPSRRRQMTTESAPTITPDYSTTADHTPMTPEPPQRIRIKSGSGFPYGTALIVLVVIAVCAGVLYAFSSAKIEITPKSQVATAAGDYTAATNGDLPFTVVTVQHTLSKSVSAESTLTANDSAQGTILISNAQTKPQQLITNTRFADSNGLIFRIHSPVTVPAGTASAPGTLSVTVYADQSGTNYNIGPSSFTVPGLKGSAAYTLVTAQSANAMAGGFTGTRAAVSQTTDDAAHTTLQSNLATTLQTDLLQKVSKDDVLVPGASVTSYSALPDTATTSETVTISEQGTLTAVVFPKDALAKAIAYKTIGTYAGEPVTLDSVAKLTLTPASTSTPADTYNFSLAGTAKILWKVDPTKIAGAVAGKSRNSAQNILVTFPEVDKVILTLRPFWTNSFPQDPSRIKVTVDSTDASK